MAASQFDDNIDEASDKLMDAYRQMLTDRLATWGIVRPGLVLVVDDLQDHSPVHPAIQRLRAFIADNDKRFRN